MLQLCTTFQNRTMRKPLLALLCSIAFLSLQAQMPGGRPGGQAGGNTQAMTGRIYGKIVDAKTNKGIEGVSVQYIQSKFDTVSRKRKDTVLSGMFTRNNGDFALEGLPMFGNFRLKVTAIGYKAVEQKVAFEMRGGDMS